MSSAVIARLSTSQPGRAMPLGESPAVSAKAEFRDTRSRVLDNQLRAALVYRVGEAADFADASVAVEPHWRVAARPSRLT